MEKMLTSITPETPIQKTINKYNIEINEQKLILEMELLSKSLIINIIDISQMLPVIYEYELTFDFFKEKDSNLSGLENISKTFDYLKSLIEQNKYSINTEDEKTYILTFKYQLFNDEKKIDISIPRQKFDEQEHNKQISLAINKLNKNYNELENKMNILEKEYQKDLLIQKEQLGLDDINKIKPSFCMKYKEKNLDIELRIINEKIEIIFIENKNIIEEKYSIKLSLKEFCLKDEYFSIMKDISSLHDFIKAIFENNKYKITKQEKEDYYILTINFISGIVEKNIDFSIVKNPFSVVESIKKYTHSINYINEKIDNNNKNTENKIVNITSNFNNYKSQNDSNLKKINECLNTNKTQSDASLNNLTNNVNNNKTQTNEQIKNITNDLNNFKKEINQKISELSDILKNKIKKEILDMSHPIGTYYWSQKNTDPSTIFGGKWESIKGRFLFAEDAKHGAGTSGGEEFHTLTADEIPSHNHGLPKPVCAYKAVPDIQIAGGGGSKKLYENDGNVANTNNVGGGKPHNNMPPYISAFCWRRTG